MRNTTVFDVVQLLPFVLSSCTAGCPALLLKLCVFLFEIQSVRSCTPIFYAVNAVGLHTVVIYLQRHYHVVL